MMRKGLPQDSAPSHLIDHLEAQITEPTLYSDAKDMQYNSDPDRSCTVPLAEQLRLLFIPCAQLSS
jgi:hypothetical protein